MARVLVVGIDPDLVDFSDPGLPPGLNAGIIHAGIETGMAALAAAGHDADRLFIGTALDTADLLRQRLAAERFDCVVVGGGITAPPSQRPLFERVLNTIAGSAGPPAIALVRMPEEFAEAANRVLPG